MTTSPLAAASDPAALAQALLGLSLDELRRLSERGAASAVDLVARHASLDSALALLDALYDGDESPTLAETRARLLLDGGRHAAAAEAARTRLARKESPTVRLLLVRALLNGGKVAEADDVAAVMLRSDPERVTPLYAAGLVALAHHDAAAARAHFERLLLLHDESPTGLRGLARVALAEGEPAAALDLAGQALDHYAEAPSELVRELQLYAARLNGADEAALAQRRAAEALAARDEAQAARDAALPQRLAQELARGRDRPPRDAIKRAPTRVRAGEDEADEPIAAGRVAALPPAPSPDPARHDALLAALHETFGYDAFRSGQEEVISAVLGGHDTLAVMPTGAGKSLCYQLPSLLRDGLTLVISPLIALMKDQVESLPPALLARTTLVNSSLESAELNLRLGAIASGRYRLVYAAPERLRQRPFIHALARAGVGLVVIDEAHCLSMWGHDFRPDYLYIRAALADLGNPRVLAMTATATPEMMGEIAAQLGRELCAVNTGVLRDNLYLMARRAENEDHKLRLLLPFVQRQHGCGIVYVASRETAEKLERQLRQAGINARAYHAGMGPAERTALQDRFMGGELRVMVATVAFGMGVDKADVRFIVHFNPPRSLEAYSQESGRAGRDGKPAVCLLLHSSADRANLTRWSKEQAVDIAGLRAVYRLLRAMLHGGQGLVDAGTLREHLEDEGQREVDLRVAISILENAGLLRRSADVPRGATITVNAPPHPRPTGTGLLAPRSQQASRLSLAGERGDGAVHAPSSPQGGDTYAPSPLEGEGVGGEGLWTRFVELAHAQPGRSVTADLTALARGMALDVTALEDHLLAWQDDERLSYRGIGRDMLIELLPPPPDTAERMAAILDTMGRRQRRQLRSLFAYLDAGRCRHALIARHFGHETEAQCRRCDVCRPVTLAEMQPVVAQRIDDPAEAVRRLVGQFPLRYGKSGVAEVLKGVTARRVHAGRTDLFGSLAHLSKGAIGRTIDALLADGELVMELHDDYRMLRLSGD